ncbi:MAG: hypothetical protein OXI26_09600 [bacterium]|nr:hypothetical protein [bacterium]
MILLDTHVLVWLVAGSERLGQRAHLALAIADRKITAWARRSGHLAVLDPAA